MLISALPVVSAALCSLYTSGATRIIQTVDCLLISSVVFRDLVSSQTNGGAIYVSSSTWTTIIDDCTFSQCEVPNSGNGGACFSSGTLQVHRCCGHACSARYEGQFISVSGGTAGDRTVLLELTSAVACSPPTSFLSAQGGISIAATQGDLIKFVNVSSCIGVSTYSDDGSAFRFTHSGSIQMMYTTISRCTSPSSVLADMRTSTDPRGLSMCNVYSCEVTRTNYGVISSVSALALQGCVLAANTGPLFYAGGTQYRYTFIGCRFDGALPTGDVLSCEANLGDGLTTLPLPHVNTAFCAHGNSVPLPTQSPLSTPTDVFTFPAKVYLTRRRMRFLYLFTTLVHE
jgi:hypothetical protein